MATPFTVVSRKLQFLDNDKILSILPGLRRPSYVGPTSCHRYSSISIAVPFTEVTAGAIFHPLAYPFRSPTQRIPAIIVYHEGCSPGMESFSFLTEPRARSNDSKGQSS